MLARSPLGRLGVPRVFAIAFLFLACDVAAFISGETLRVDGGIVVGT
jgi:3-oxoacyl-[acyl-carrier protein] reductase